MLLPPVATLPASVALYEALGEDGFDDALANKGGRRKGKPKPKQPGTVEEVEEEDDRLYCICQSRYDANVDVSTRCGVAHPGQAHVTN